MVFVNFVNAKVKIALPIIVTLLLLNTCVFYTLNFNFEYSIMITNCFGFFITPYLAIMNYQTVVTLKASGCAPVPLNSAKENQNQSTFCDDGKTKIEVDWPNLSTSEYTCTNPEGYVINPKTKPKTHYDSGVKSFKAKHFCMDTKITYNKVFQTYGDSRPVWAHYGEYKFVPPQRGFHNLENGAIVALYHPCADKNEVRKFKFLVKGCLRRHLITPYKGLTKKRPLVLLSWGWYLEMNFMDETKAVKFIRKHAIKHAPENIGTDGEYDYGLKEKPTQEDTSDKKLCPNYK